MSQSNSVGKKLQEIYDGKEPALRGLERLVQHSSTLASALRIAQAQPPEMGEKVAQVFLNTYSAGFIAGVDHVIKATPEGK